MLIMMSEEFWDHATVFQLFNCRNMNISCEEEYFMLHKSCSPLDFDIASLLHCREGFVYIVLRYSWLIFM